MEYMLLLYSDETLAAKIDAPERAQAFREFAVVTGQLLGSGKLKSSHPLQPTASATTVRLRDGKAAVTDGPFAETNEQLGGYYIVEAENLDEAIRIATRLPTARYGCVEIRPLMRLEPPPGASGVA